MTGFWIACALLALIAAAFVVVPLLRAARQSVMGPARAELNAAVYRDHLQELDRELAEDVLSADQHALARRELDRRVIAETALDAGAAPVPTGARPVSGRWLALGGVALVPLLALGIYLKIGNPGALQPPEQQFVQMVDQLAARLASKQDDPDGWVMLGRAYQLMGRMQEAVSAFEKASALKPDNADLIASHADALAMVQGSLSGRPRALVERALELDPKNQTALALAATTAMETRQFSEAIVFWQRLAVLVDPASPDRKMVEDAMTQTRQAAAAAGVKLDPASAPAKDVRTNAERASVSGEVALAPELAAQARPEETVFVIARAIDGAPVPLAVLRARVKDLPLRFTLDDTLSMAPGAMLSLHKTVIISARVSRSGQALPQPGDLVGTVKSVTVGATGVSVTISEIVR